MTIALLWFRRDLRLDDNPALCAALDRHEQVLPFYVHDPEGEAPWQAGQASNWWLHHSLASLRQQLTSKSADLHLAKGDSLSAIKAVCKSCGVTAVYWNRVYEPAAIARDREIKSALRELGIEVESFAANLLFEPFAVQTANGDPYRVFTPFWRNASRELQLQMGSGRAPLECPESVPVPRKRPRSVALEQFELLPRIPWDAGLEAAWAPGSAQVHDDFETFLDDALEAYPASRDQPGKEGTSRLSAALHFGECSPLQLVARIRKRQKSDAAAAYVRELGWREFAHHLLYHYPHTVERPLNARFESFPWRKPREYAGDLERWQRGMTGIPIVDAGLRELWTSGWMHNRVRMIVASFLTKNLRIPWQEGAAWFWDTLVDADLANNTLGWQWVAGSGADAAPYFRIFNPALQSARFDAQGRYLRRWLPELARLPDKHLHAPWEAPAEILREASVELGRDYPQPMVDLKQSRQDALDAYQQIKGA